jgi:hypothetical protein
MAEHLPECLNELAKELPLTMSKSQAATVMQMSIRTLERAMERGELVGMKSNPGQRCRVIITRAEVLRWMSARVDPGAAR